MQVRRRRTGLVLVGIATVALLAVACGPPAPTETATSTRSVVRAGSVVFGFSAGGDEGAWGTVDHVGDPYWTFAETANGDMIAALTGAPGGPDTNVPSTQRPANGIDDSFVDVDVFNPLP